MQAVAYLAPAIAPLAFKLIDKYMFDDQPAPVPQIIQIPVPSPCACCCGKSSTAKYDNNSDRSCSTCASKSSSYYEPSKRSRLCTKSSVRSSSTGDAYEKEKSKSLTRSRSTLRINDDAGKSEKKSDKYCGLNTLDILAVNLKEEILKNHGKGKRSSRVQESRSSEKSSSKYKYGSISGKSSRRIDHESKSLPCRKRNSDSDGFKVSKADCSGC